MISRLAVLAACLVAVLTACGGSGGGASDPGAALADTASKLGEIRSGKLKLRLVVDPKEEGGEFGFELSGPFQLADPGELPVAEIEYTQIADEERETVTITATGDRAYVTIDGTAYELPADQADRLRRAAESAGGGEGGLGKLRIDDWMRNVESSGGTEVSGDATDKITADLAVVAAANDLLELASGIAGDRRLEGAEARQLREAVRDAKIEVLTGTEDRLLRRLKITASFAPDLPEELSNLSRAAGADFEFELEIAGPNEPVDVQAPADARPYSERNG